MKFRTTLVGSLAGAALLAVASLAGAIPVELKDSNDTKYWVNTDVNFSNTSNASGALTNATYTKPVTVTSTWIAFTPWWGFTTVYTVQYEVNVPLEPAFFGFNGLAVVGYDNQSLASPLVYNPSMQLESQECEQNGENRQLVFQPQAFASHNLTLQRKVFVPHNDDYARWINIITNTDDTATAEVDVSLLGKLGSTINTTVKATSTGDSSLGVQDTWFTTAQVLPDNAQSFQPKLGFVVQGDGAASPATALSINTEGQTAATYHLTIPAGESQIILFYTTVQGKGKQAKKTCENLVDLPSKALTCLTEEELAEVVNFAHITPPVTSKAQIKLNFKKAADGKTDVDSVSWKGTVDLGAGIDLQGLSVTVDVAGVNTTFLLNDKGKANDGGGNSFSVKPKLQDGVTEAGSAKFTIKLKGDYQAALAPYGWTNADVDDAALTAPLEITVTGGGSFNTNQPFTYDATEGKSGTGKYKQSS